MKRRRGSVLSLGSPSLGATVRSSSRQVVAGGEALGTDRWLWAPSARAPQGSSPLPEFPRPYSTARLAFKSSLEQPPQKRALIDPGPVSKQLGAAPQGRLCVWSGCPGSGPATQTPSAVPPSGGCGFKHVRLGARPCTTLLQGQVKANMGCAPRRLPP